MGVAVKQRGVVVQEVQACLPFNISQPGALPRASVERIGRRVNGGPRVPTRQARPCAVRETCREGVRLEKSIAESRWRGNGHAKLSSLWNDVSSLGTVALS